MKFIRINGEKMFTLYGVQEKLQESIFESMLMNKTKLESMRKCDKQANRKMIVWLIVLAFP